jgi:hypothetical protein
VINANATLARMPHAVDGRLRRTENLLSAHHSQRRNKQPR